MARGTKVRRYCRSWLALAGLLALPLLAGCSKQAVEPPSVLRISQRNEPNDLDPATASLPDDFFIIRALSEGLLAPNPAGGAPLPAAADRFTVSADGLTYTFHLRPAGRWSNGEPVAADDFIFSFRRVLTAATAAPKAHLFFEVKNAREFLRGELADFSEVGLRAPDTSTVVVTLRHPNRNFPLWVASGAWIPVNPRAVTKYGRGWTAPEHYVGNGPFVLAAWRPQQLIVVRKSPTYRAEAAAQVPAIEFVRFDSQDTEDRAYRAAQIDVTMAVPQTKLATYAHERPAELHRAALAETRFLSFNTRRAPLSDARVRRALSLAIDRTRIVRDVLKGGQEPAFRFLSPVLRPPSDGKGLAGQQDDPAEARRLLAAAGYPEGRGFPRLELAGWDRNPALEAIQEMWRATLGIEVSLVVQEARVHLAALNAGSYDIAFATTLLDVADAATALGDFTAHAPNNFPHWESPEFDRLVRLAGEATDSAHARDALEEAEQRLLEAAPIAPVYFNVQNWLMAPRVHGWEQDALWARRYNDVSLQ